MDTDTIAAIKTIGAAAGGGFLTFVLMAALTWKYIRTAISEAKKSAAAADEVVAKAAETPIDQWRLIVQRQDRQIAAQSKRITEVEEGRAKCEAETYMLKQQTMAQQHQMDWNDKTIKVLTDNQTTLVNILKQNGLTDTAAMTPLPAKPLSGIKKTIPIADPK